VTARISALLFLLIAIVGCEAGDRGIVHEPVATELDADASVTSPAEVPTDVIFVCQFGYAKSLVSSRHFERIAERRGIPVRVFARAITPADSVPERLVNALGEDGFDVTSYRPQALGMEELADAEYVISFGNEVPEGPNAVKRDWADISALSEDYPKARNEIVDRLNELLDEIEAHGVSERTDER
jgi:protein-tyrosine-phosphatase